MRAAVSPAAAVLLALLAGPVAADDLNQYKTEVVKGAACATGNNPLGPFYIPDNQCTGVIYDLPQYCERLEMVKITVMDYAHAKVTVDDSLRTASVERAANLAGACPGRAAVRAVLGCSEPLTMSRTSRLYMLPSL